MSKPCHELKFNHHDLYYNSHACIYFYHDKNALNAKTGSSAAKITIVSQLYHHLKFNNHGIYYNPHACIYPDYEKNASNVKTGSQQQTCKHWQSQLKKPSFLKTNPKWRTKHLWSKEDFSTVMQHNNLCYIIH